MAGYDDAKFNGWAQPAMYASLAVAVTGAILSIANSGGGGGLSGDRYFKCLKCGHSISMSIEESIERQKEENLAFIDNLAQTNPAQAEVMRKIMDGNVEMMGMRAALPSWGTFRWPFECDSCGERTMISARKCLKCGEVFCPYDEQGNYNDKCINPKCGYSAAEERKAKRKKGKKKR
ncbi:MAG: hypothetical protein KAJ46_06325 [Sedimentisphaerales bacterium]|nr:hypothetical protein [Sedimentisphaerales bacterium]